MSDIAMSKVDDEFVLVSNGMEDVSIRERPSKQHTGRPINDDLVGIVDMGSNGIRLSVTNLETKTARMLPSIFDLRIDISLYDSQFDPETGDKIPIPQHVIDEVVAGLTRFRITCDDLGVSPKNIRVVATEATRAAINSKDFISAIEMGTHIPVQLLKKEDEGAVGALGVASGFSHIEGLMMDLGGGSTQFTWIIAQGGNVRVSPHGSFSFPYGAAALTKRMAEIQKDKSKEDAEHALEDLRNEITKNYREAYESLALPDSLVEKAERDGGFPLYLSGGGFRGWGYLLLHMNQTKGHHYPISIINGFTIGKKEFEDTRKLKDVARLADSIFRISDRRREQVPAVAFLINAFTDAIPHGVLEAHFCQGGVREGVLYRELPPSIRVQHPLEVSTAGFAPPSVDSIRKLLEFSIPKPSRTGERAFPKTFSKEVIAAFANGLYYYAFLSKESASTSALYSTIVGPLSSVRGISHQDRARLALTYEARYMGELPPREAAFKKELAAIITPEEVWWASYIGKIGYVISRLYPSGNINETKPRVLFSAEWSWTLGKKRNREGLVLTVSVQKKHNDPAKMKEALDEHRKIVEKVGKKKNWAGGPEGWGMKVVVKVVEEDIL